MKKKWLIFGLAAVVLLVYALFSGFLVEKNRVNPIPDDVDAIVFWPEDDGELCRVITDEAVIDKLRAAYRWTNGHMFCCMEKPLEYLDVIIAGETQSAEASEYHESLLTDSYNWLFRILLHRARNEAPVLIRKAVMVRDDVALPAVQKLFPDYFVYCRDLREDDGQWELNILSGNVLTAEDEALLAELIQ